MQKKIYVFQDIIAWQKAKELTVLLYRKFSSHRDFGFRDQILRASVSVMNNIAEGYERGTKPDFKRFLFMSKGSNAEVRSLLILGTELGYCTAQEFQMYEMLSEEIGKLLSGFIKKL